LEGVETVFVGFAHRHWCVSFSVYVEIQPYLVISPLTP
jgi:hypothetical protein